MCSPVRQWLSRCHTFRRLFCQRPSDETSLRLGCEWRCTDMWHCSIGCGRKPNGIGLTESQGAASEQLVDFLRISDVANLFGAHGVGKTFLAWVWLKEWQRFGSSLSINLRNSPRIEFHPLPQRNSKGTTNSQRFLGSSVKGG